MEIKPMSPDEAKLALVEKVFPVAKAWHENGIPLYAQYDSGVSEIFSSVLLWARNEMVKEVAIEKHKEMEEMLGVYSAVGDTSVRIGDCSDTLTRLAEDIIKE